MTWKFVLYPPCSVQHRVACLKMCPETETGCGMGSFVLIKITGVVKRKRLCEERAQGRLDIPAVFPEMALRDVWGKLKMGRLWGVRAGRRRQ